MSGVNPNGEQKYWFDGLPFEGVAKTTPVDEGTQKYWFNGLPGEYLYVTGGGATVEAVVSTGGHTLLFMGAG